MSNDLLPLVAPLGDLAPLAAFARLQSLPYCLWLDSARLDAQLGRYAFLAADPFEVVRADAEAVDPLQDLQQRIAPYAAASVPGLPPFQGGAAGLLSYDLARTLERVAAPRFDEFALPRMVMGLYDVVLAFDLEERKAWLISQGWPERDPKSRHERAAARLATFRARLAAPPSPASTHPPTSSLKRESIAPLFEMPEHPGVLSNFSKAAYLVMVERGIEYIRAGDLFQVNLAQRLLAPVTCDAATLYLRLRDRNPATFGGYFDFGSAQILSASPERFLKVRSGHVETRPIKGTRPRGGNPRADLSSADELKANAKDRAENVMIVDLLRNDLSRVCVPDSVCVTQLCGVERFEFVQHLVSVIEGKLAPGATPLQLLRAAFPGGSITGAPKIRAMQIIAELEQVARGAYCGSLGYLGFDGTLDTNLLIRTITAARGWWQFPVGGGIVVQSEPAQEYAETWHKAQGLLRALK